MMRSNGSGESVSVIVGRLCQETVRATSVDGGSVALVSTEASRAVLSVTDPLAMALEEAQMALGEGPYVDAVHSLSPMMVSDLREPGTAAARWPFFAKEAKSLDVCALFAFPLTVSSLSVGSIGLYRRQAGNLNTQHLGMALNAAHDISRALVDQATWADVPRKSASKGHGRLTLGTAQIHQAAGMVMIQLDVTIDEAMALLRAAAWAESNALDDVARDVVQRRRRLRKVSIDD